MKEGACASSTARAAGWSMKRRSTRRSRPDKVAGAALDVFLEEPAQKQPAVRRCPTSSAPRIWALRPPKRRKTWRCRLPSRFRPICNTGEIANARQLPLDHGRGGAAPQAVHRARRAARLVRRPAHEGGISKIQISYEGAVAQMKTKALTSAAMAGFLRPMLQDVNVVSAPVVAKERGIIIRGDHARG